MTHASNRTRIFAALLAILITVNLIPLSGIQADIYSPSITGIGIFEGVAYREQNFTGWITVKLPAEAEDPVDIAMIPMGEITGWFTWLDPSNLTLIPNVPVTTRYTLNFPSSNPGTYRGGIFIGQDIPPGSSGTATVTVLVAREFSIKVSVPSAIGVSYLGSYEEWAWTNVTYSAGGTFTGSAKFQIFYGGVLSEEGTENFGPIDSYVTTSIQHDWTTPLTPGESYSMRVEIFDSQSRLQNEKQTVFRVPSPADIISLTREPKLVYPDIQVRATALTRDVSANVVLYYQHTQMNSPEELDMVFDASKNGFVVNLPMMPPGSVSYWAVSKVGGYTYTQPTRYFEIWGEQTPDLHIKGVNRAISQNMVDLEVTLENQGRGDVGNFSVLFLVDGNLIETIDMRSTGSNQFAMNGESQTTIFFKWEHTPGTHNFSVVIDPDNQVVEGSESNNIWAIDLEIEETQVSEKPVNTTSPFMTYGLPMMLLLIIIIMLALNFLRSRKQKKAKNRILEEDEE